MSFSIHWTAIAEISFNEETEFILLKWNLNEVANFVNITESFLNVLRENPFIGKHVKEKDIYSFVISKQTTLFYKVYTDLQKIDLLLFHNNKRNLADLLKKI